MCTCTTHWRGDLIFIYIDIRRECVISGQIYRFMHRYCAIHDIAMNYLSTTVALLDLYKMDIVAI